MGSKGVLWGSWGILGDPVGFKGALWGSQSVLRGPMGSLVGSRSCEALSVFKVVQERLRGSCWFYEGQ